MTTTLFDPVEGTGLAAVDGTMFRGRAEGMVTSGVRVLIVGAWSPGTFSKSRPSKSLGKLSSSSNSAIVVSERRELVLLEICNT